MSLKRGVIVLLAFVFAIFLNVYLYLHSVLRATFAGRTNTVSNACEDTQDPAEKVNPNKLLFISCGGFFD